MENTTKTEKKAGTSVSSLERSVEENGSKEKKTKEKKSKGKDTKEKKPKGRNSKKKTQKKTTKKTTKKKEKAAAVSKMSLDELRTEMSERIVTRYNRITGRYECRWVDRNDDDRPRESIKGDEFSRLWHEMTDREENALWQRSCPNGERNLQEVLTILRSDFSPVYSPISDYINDAFTHYDGEGDPIGDLISHVHIKAPGNPANMKSPLERQLYEQQCREEQRRFNEYFRKWFVGMVASAVFCDRVNNVVLVLIGQQGTYKSTFFASLLPPELKKYYYVKTDNTLLNKDDRLQLANNLLICLEEIDSLSPKETNQLKAMVTLAEVKERPAYARNFVTRHRVASLCGTGNNEAFLTDLTGSRRWLPFLVENIDDPRTYNIDYVKLYAHAMNHVVEEYRYWFTLEEIQLLNERNRMFEVECSEEQLIQKYYRHPADHEAGTFVTSSDILEKINKYIKKSLSTVKIGKVMSRLGYEKKMISGFYKYHVVELEDTEIQQIRKEETAENDPRVF